MQARNVGTTWRTMAKA